MSLVSSVSAGRGEAGNLLLKDTSREADQECVAQRDVERSTGGSDQAAKQNLSYVAQRRKASRRHRKHRPQNTPKYVPQRRGMSSRTKSTKHKVRVVGHRVGIVRVGPWQSEVGKVAERKEDSF